MTKGTYKDLRVWQDAVKLASNIYRATALFPRHEVYGLSQQMRRAAVSVPSNIAEGKGHRSNWEFTNFLLHARGSLLELQTQLHIAEDLQYLSGNVAQGLHSQTDSVARNLNALINAVRGEGAPANDQRRTTNDHV
jgi:four helix bundle protein